MGRSRSFNRFHRYLARQKRSVLRTALPQHREGDEVLLEPINHSKDLLDRVTGQEVRLELLDSEL
ncbi:hypothetical protein [Parasynechococcus sp.]|jgi:uncharacterized protein YbgA (DUF1722 family)|uniref:hypothetical protein n=1 Tax=Parasynechococcus sp. TaxID=3101203 RepID=UPI003704A1CD